MMTSSPGFTSARKTDAIASVAPHVTVISRSGSISMSYHFRYFAAIARRSAGHRKIRKSLSEIDRAVLVSDTSHFANDGFGERRSALRCFDHACSVLMMRKGTDRLTMLKLLRGSQP